MESSQLHDPVLKIVYCMYLLLVISILSVFADRNLHQVISTVSIRDLSVTQDQTMYNKCCGSAACK